MWVYINDKKGLKNAIGLANANICTDTFLFIYFFHATYLLKNFYTEFVGFIPMLNILAFQTNHRVQKFQKGRIRTQLHKNRGKKYL